MRFRFAFLAFRSFHSARHLVTFATMPATKQTSAKQAAFNSLFAKPKNVIATKPEASTVANDGMDVDRDGAHI